MVAGAFLSSVYAFRLHLKQNLNYLLNDRIPLRCHWVCAQVPQTLLLHELMKIFILPDAWLGGIFQRRAHIIGLVNDLTSDYLMCLYLCAESRINEIVMLFERFSWHQWFTILQNERIVIAHSWNVQFNSLLFYWEREIDKWWFNRERDVAILWSSFWFPIRQISNLFQSANMLECS